MCSEADGVCQGLDQALGGREITIFGTLWLPAFAAAENQLSC